MAKKIKITSDNVRELNNGLYKIYWKKSSGGGSSLAAVGRYADGQRLWLAPTNWISSEEEISFSDKNWGCVKSVKLVKSKR